MANTRQELVTRFKQLFRGRENIHGKTTLTPAGEKKDSWVVHAPPKEQDWTQHLEGKVAGLGIGVSTLANQCYFAAIDLDDDHIDHASLAALIEQAKLPLVVCRSKSGGAHLFLFLKDPTPAKLVVEKLKSWVEALGLKNPTREVDGKSTALPVEVFPKNVRLKPDETGNWINLPYYGNGSTNRFAVTAEGDQLPLKAFLDLAERVAVSSAELPAIVPANSPFEDGPPCLTTLHGIGYPEGSRNMGLYNVGIFFKLKDPDTWQEELEHYNQTKLDPPLKDKELIAIQRSLEKRDYVYKCEELPIQPHCEKARCRRQKYGILGFRRKKNEDSMPPLDHLRKVTTDPPRWILQVEDQDVELQTDDLMLIPRFRKAVLERCNRIFPLIKQGDWDDVLTGLLQTQTIIEAPPDAGTKGQFEYLLGEFLIRRHNSTSREDLLAGLPYEEGPRTYFRSADLMAFLDRKKFRAFDANKVYTELRSLGAGHDKFNIKGAGLQVWYVPTPQDQQKEEFSKRVDSEPEF